MFMEEQLVTFDTAKLAKEKGFDSPCNYYFFVDFDYNEITDKTVRDKIDLKEFSFETIRLGKSLLSDRKLKRPTQSLLQKWLREVHNIRIVVDSNPIDLGVFMWFYQIKTGDGFNNVPIFSGDFNSYEEALEEGLLQGLKLIKI